MHGLHTRRRDHHRQREFLSHHGCRELALLQCTDAVRGETELTERFDVVGDGQPLLARRDQGTVDGLGQSLLRPLLGDGNRFEPGIACHVFDRPFCAGFFWSLEYGTECRNARGCTLGGWRRGGLPRRGRRSDRVSASPGGDAGSHQTPRRRQHLEHVHAHVEIVRLIGRFQQRRGSKESGGPEPTIAT